jgi:hypothetical protein
MVHYEKNSKSFLSLPDGSDKAKKSFQATAPLRLAFWLVYVMKTPPVRLVVYTKVKLAQISDTFQLPSAIYFQPDTDNFDLTLRLRFSKLVSNFKVAS